MEKELELDDSYMNLAEAWFKKSSKTVLRHWHPDNNTFIRTSENDEDIKPAEFFSSAAFLSRI